MCPANANPGLAPLQRWADVLCVSLCAAYYGSAFGMGALAGNIYLNHIAIYMIEIPVSSTIRSPALTTCAA